MTQALTLVSHLLCPYVQRAAIALHGLVDSFLGFTPTYILMAVVLGLASGCAGLTTHADRV